jgi:methionine sulfoxide reductase heme-binding subunit
MSRITGFQIGAHVLAWGLAGWLVVDALTGNLTVNPIQAATQRTGRYALYLLALSLSMTPLNTLFGWRQALPARRTFGLYAFLFAFIHFIIFIGVDYGFNWEFIRTEIIDKNYILVGATALSLLLALAVTSFKWWMKRLGKNWKRLHRLVYLAAPLVIVHFTWARKGDVFSLQGNIIQPLVLGVIVGLLLILRLPRVKAAAGRALRFRPAKGV